LGDLARDGAGLHGRSAKSRISLWVRSGCGNPAPVLPRGLNCQAH
jgi:hypothetical protein